MSDSDIFDFQISLEARDQANDVLDKALARYLKLDSAIQKGEMRAQKVSQTEKALRADQNDQERRFSAQEESIRNNSLAEEMRAFEARKLFFAEEMRLQQELFDHQQRLAERSQRKKEKEPDPPKQFKDLYEVFEEFKTQLKDFGSLFDETYLKIEANIHSFTSTTSFSMQEAQSRTDSYINSVLKLSAATGASTEDISEFAMALAESSVYLDDADIVAQSKSLLQLSTIYGVAGEQVASLVSNTRFLGLAIGETLDSAAQASAKFKVPKLLENLPEILNTVNDLYSDFGDRVVGDSKVITDSFISQAGAVSQAYNITIPDAINKVRETTQKFIEEIDKIDDIRLGLGTDFGEGTQALFQLGFSVQDVQSLLKQGTTDALGFAEAVRNAAADRPLMQQERLLKLIGREFGGQTKELLLRESVYQSMVAARDEANAAEMAGIVTFSSMVESSRKTGAKMIEVFNTLVDLGKTIIGGVFGRSAKTIFGGTQDALTSLNNALISLNERMTDKDGFFQTKIAPILEPVATALLSVSGAIASVVGAMAWFGVASKSLEYFSKASKFLFDPKKTTWITGLFGKLGNFGKVFAKLGKTFTKTLGLPLLIIDGIATALYSMGAVFADPKATGVDKFEALIVGVFDGLDSMLFNIPSMLGKFFFPNLGAAMNDGFRNILGSFQTMFSGGLSRIVDSVADSIEGVLSGINEYLWSFLDTSDGFFRDIGSRIGAGFAGLVDIVTDGLSWGVNFSIDLISDGVRTLFGWMTGKWIDSASNRVRELGFSLLETVSLAIIGAANAVGEVVIGIGDGMLNYFGVSFASLWLSAKAGFYDYLLDPIRAGISNVSSWVDEIRYAFTDTWISISSSIQTIWGDVVSYMTSSLADSFDTLANIVGYLSKTQADNIRSMAEKARKFGGVDPESIKEEERIAKEQNSLWLTQRQKVAEEERKQREEASFARMKEIDDTEKALADSLTKRSQMEKAQRKRAKEDLKREKSADVAAKESEFLRNNKDWLAAVSQANAAVDRARKEASGGGVEASNRAAEAEGLRQAAELNKLRSILLGTGDGSTSAARASSDSPMKITVENSSAMQTEAEKPLPPPDVMVEAEPGTPMDSLVNLFEELLLALKDMPTKEVSVKVDVSKDAIIREIKQIQQGQRGRRGM